VLARTDFPDELAYRLTRALHKARMRLASVRPQARESRVEISTRRAAAEMIHPGTLRYLKEIGAAPVNPPAAMPARASTRAKRERQGPTKRVSGQAWLEFGQALVKTGLRQVQLGAQASVGLICARSPCGFQKTWPKDLAAAYDGLEAAPVESTEGRACSVCAPASGAK